jgi:tetratricopeptide (TPR) repeat protein
VRGELDWIVMKALEKDRNRRYETANNFAADVMRYLTDHPVEACPPSGWYRFTKYARRHRAGLTTVAVVGLALVAGTAVSTWQVVRATRAGAAARNSAAEAEAVIQFLTKDVLGAPDPAKALGRDPRISEVLADAEKKVETGFPGQPLVEARVRDALAQTYLSLGRHDVARRHASRALELQLPRLGAEHPDTLKSQFTEGAILLQGGPQQVEEARGLFEREVEILRRTLGPESNDTLHATNNLAVALGKQGKLTEARKLFEQVLEVRRRTSGPEHPDTLGAMHNLAVQCQREEKYDEARRLFEQLLEARRRVLGPDHPDTLHTMYVLAMTLGQLGKVDEANALYEQTLKIRRRIMGPDHPETLQTMHDLAVGLGAKGKQDEARKLFELVLAIRRRSPGPEHPQTLDTMFRLAQSLQETGQEEEAIKLLEETLEIRLRVVDPADPVTRRAMYLLVDWLVASPVASSRDLSRALEVVRRAVELSPKDGLTRQSLGWLLCRVGDWMGCIKLMEKPTSDPENCFVVAMAHWHLGKKTQARVAFDRGDAWLKGYEQHYKELVKHGRWGVPTPRSLRRLRAEAAALMGLDASEREGKPNTAPEPAVSPN